MSSKRQNYKPEKVTLKEYIKIFKGIKIPWVFLILILVATFAMTLASLQVTYFTGDVVDAQGNVPTAQLVSYALGYIVMGLCSAASVIFQGVASEKINLGLRKKLWRKLIYTKQSCYDADGGETLVSRVTTDCDYASRLFTTIVSFISLAISLGMYIFQMYALNITLSNYMLLLIPVSILIGWGYTKLMYLIAQKTQAMLASSTAYLIERTKDLALIKTSNTQSREMEEGSKRFQEQYVMQVKTGLMNAFYTALQTLYNIVSILIPFAVGAGMVASGLITAGEVIIFYGISTSVGVSFTNIINYAGTIRQANGALARVINTFKLPDEAVVSGRPMDEPDGDITFENVSFGYNGEPVLQNITCQIPKHKVTAVIGANGSGKSTLFKLLDRLYDPGEGMMRFGKTNAADYDLHAWRKAFAMVAQGSPLMEGTIRENICYGCERTVSQEELVKVAKAARVYDFVQDLPDGFGTMITGGGQNFSGGQRQCLAIARAMMISPDYLLLDEATSNLDAKSERAVLAAMDELMKNRTTVIIAHSLAAIRKADHVIVLSDGQVSATGSPAQILSAGDNYLSKVMHRKDMGAMV